MTSFSATSTGAPTSSALAEMIAQAALHARKPAPIANLLCSELEWYAARPLTPPTSLTVRLWTGQTARIFRQYQDLLALLVEMQVNAFDADRQMHADLFAAAEEMLGPTQEN